MLICLSLLSLPAFTEEMPDLSAILEKTKAMKLCQDPYWRTLLHYKPAGGGHYRSLVDDPDFFLATNGKTDPEAELRATITAFFSAPAEGVTHATAKFPARYAWIREKLAIPAARFPYDGDKDFYSLKSRINPGAIYLVFPAGYMKNPASMFGHTFLLIESQGKSRLLAYSVNYGAVSGPDSSLVYALKGLTGAYRGYYSFLPYYQKIREYADIDMRDMWEYRLKLTDEETDRLLRHIVELSGIYSDYYFISENCSYNLLFLIEAAKPETKLTDRLKTIVEPIETVKLLKELGIAEDYTYRPSLYSRIKYGMSRLSFREKSYVKDICFGKKNTDSFPFSGLEIEKQACIWDLSADYLKFLLTGGKISPADYRSRMVAVLSRRTKLGQITQDTIPPVPEPPHLAHGSGRISTEAGKDSSGLFSAVSFRLLAHEIMDTDPGYTRNSQLAFCRVDFRYRYADKAVSLRSADIADIISLPVSDMFFYNSAFQFRTGLETNTGENRDETLAWRVKYSYGVSLSPADSTQLYFLGGFDTYFSPEYEYGTDLLLGGEAGVLTSAGLWKGKLSASIGQSPFTPVHTRYDLSLEERFSVSRNLSVTGSYSYKGDYGDHWQEYSVMFNIFF